MSARLTRHDGPAPGRAQLHERAASDGTRVESWSNGPGDTYSWHQHPYRKVLYCVRGGIVFHTRDGDFELRPGDRIDVDPGTPHAATVGPDGVECVEAHV